MTRPATTQLLAGIEGWDSIVNDNDDVHNGPYPIKEYANIAALVAIDASTFDRCIAATTDDGKLWISNGAFWVPVEGGSALGAFGRLQTSEVASGALSGASHTYTGLFPANVVRLGVTLKNEVAVTGATTYDAGDGTDVDRYGAAIAIALDTTATMADATADPSSGGWNAAAGDVVLTGNGGSFTGGDVTAVAHYIDLSPPQ